MKMDVYKVGLFEDLNFRFLIADCSNATNEAVLRHNLENSSAILVTKTMLASFFLACMVKEGVAVNLQLEGNGAMERVMAYSDRIGRMRGLAKFPNIQSDSNDVTDGIGKGFFRVTRWGGVHKIHQSITKLDLVPFEQNIINYINDSEQVVSFISMSVSNEAPFSAKGIILQTLPFTDQKLIDAFMDGMSKIDMDTRELFSNSLDHTISILEEALNTKATILEEGKPEFYCGCNIDKIKDVIVTLGRDEAYSIIEEQSKIEMVCEFCAEKYSLDAEEVRLLFL